ncbi:MAG: 30S ribosomal protein S4 [Thermoproteota archaeon]|jgi:small subunit ribosomal protein S4|nr:30S ribosomal protein S4 [Thermoproteota archaeon]
MRRFKKTWEGPRHPWRKDVLLAEIDLLGRYGLKNKRELWKMKTILRKIRKRARALLALSPTERAIEEEKLKNLLIKYGLIDENADISAILSLTIEDILKRRLQTVVYNLKLANSIYHARQLIVHKKVMVGDRIISSPSYLVKKDEEDKIKII